MEEVIIIGCGPVGCAISLLLAKQGKYVKLYESRNEISNNPEESYPIGVNARGLYTLEKLGLDELCKSASEIVDSWQIYSGERKVAHLESGVVYGTSRSKVNFILFRAVLKEKNIKVYFNHKLKDIDFDRKFLCFTIYNNNNASNDIIEIDASTTRVIACDGVNSAVRRQMESKLINFTASLIPWTNEYRVLFAPVGKLIDGLDTKVHYIFTSCYTATVADEHGKQRWTLVMTARDSDPPDERATVLATEATPENIKALTKLIQKRAPMAAKLFEDDLTEYQRYFSRRSFRGAIVDCNTCRSSEWLCLLGDSHHSVLPPSGEGVNSGLEDTLMLAEAFADTATTHDTFQVYEQRRLPALRGLLEYATYLNQAPTFSGEKVARLIFLILEGIMTKNNNITSNLFGPLSKNRPKYDQIFSKWSIKKFWVLNIIRLIVYPITALVEVVISPWTVYQLLTADTSTTEKYVIDYTLKPPV